jgi:hypothetical protein
MRRIHLIQRLFDAGKVRLVATEVIPRHLQRLAAGGGGELGLKFRHLLMMTGLLALMDRHEVLMLVAPLIAVIHDTAGRINLIRQGAEYLAHLFGGRDAVPIIRAVADEVGGYLSRHLAGDVLIHGWAPCWA